MTDETRRADAASKKTEKENTFEAHMDAAREHWIAGHVKGGGQEQYHKQKCRTHYLAAGYDDDMVKKLVDQDWNLKEGFEMAYPKSIRAIELLTRIKNYLGEEYMDLEV